MDFFIQSANAQGIMDGGADLMGLAPLVLIFVAVSYTHLTLPTIYSV